MHSYQRLKMNHIAKKLKVAENGSENSATRDNQRKDGND